MNRNELLADIVELSGGTVTNPNNRNQLLRDWLDAIGGNPQVVNYDNILVFGASIMHEAFAGGGYIDTYSPQILGRCGFGGVTMYAKTQSGATSPVYITMAAEAVEEFQLTGNTLVIIHGSGNDVSNTRPYAGVVDQDALGNNMRTVIETFLNNNWDVAYMGVSWRNYTDVPPQSNGSEPYNEFQYYPLIRDINEFWWDYNNNVPKINMYEFTKSTDGALLDDPTHPFNGACEIAVNAFILGAAGRAANQVVYDYRGKTIAGCVTNNFEIVETSDGVGTASGSAGAYYPDSNGDLSPLHFCTTLGSINSSGVNNSGITGYSLISEESTNNSIYTSSASVMPGYFWTGSKSYAGLTGVVKFAGSRSSTTGTRFTDFTLDGVTKTTDCEANPPEFVEFPFVVDDNGNINFTWNKAAGSSYCYFCSFQLDFD